MFSKFVDLVTSLNKFWAADVVYDIKDNSK